MSRTHKTAALDGNTQQHDSRWWIAGDAATVGRGQPIQKRTRGHALKVLRNRWMRADPLCRLCSQAGRHTAATERDHVIPLCQGGTDADENLQSLCRECHRIKSAREMGKRPVLGCDADGIPRDEAHHWSAR